MTSLKKIISGAMAVAMVASLSVNCFAIGLTTENLESAELDTAAGTLAGVAYNEYKVEGSDVAVETPSGDASSVVEITAESSFFMVSTPILLRVNMAADATMTYPDSMEDGNDGAAKIINLCPNGMVAIEDVNIVEANEYAIADWADEFENKKVNTKEFGFKLNGLEVKTDGKLDGFVAEATETIDTVKTNDAVEDIDAEFADYTITRSNDNTVAFPVIRNASVLPIYYEAKLPATSSPINNLVVGGVVFTLNFA